MDNLSLFCKIGMGSKHMISIHVVNRYERCYMVIMQVYNDSLNYDSTSASTAAPEASSGACSASTCGVSGLSFDALASAFLLTFSAYYIKVRSGLLHCAMLNTRSTSKSRIDRALYKKRQ